MLLESAIKVMDLYASSKAILEIEYFDEVGTGLVIFIYFLYFFISLFLLFF